MNFACFNLKWRTIRRQRQVDRQEANGAPIWQFTVEMSKTARTGPDQDQVPRIRPGLQQQGPSYLSHSLRHGQEAGTGSPRQESYLVTLIWTWASWHQTKYQSCHSLKWAKILIYSCKNSLSDIFNTGLYKKSPISFNRL